MKLVSWNIEHGLRRLNDLPTIMEQFGSPDVLCLQELRIRAQDSADIARLQDALPRYRCHFSLPRDARNVTFHGGRMYGVATFVRSGWRGVSRTARDAYPRLRTEGPHPRARAELNAGLTRKGFVDIWRERHPDERAYTWFNRRARGLDAARVDYILVSDELVPRVRSADILDLLPWGDHAPVRLEL